MTSEIHPAPPRTAQNFRLGKLTHENGYTTFEGSFDWCGSRWRLTWHQFAWTDEMEAYARGQIYDWPRQHVPVFGLSSPGLEKVGPSDV